MIRAVVLDYGGVLSLPHGAAERAAAAAGLGVPDDAAFEAAYWEHRLAYDRGDLTAGEYWAAVAASLGVAPPGRLDRVVAADAAGWAHLDDAVVSWARGLAERVTVGLLSNMPREVRGAAEAALAPRLPLAAAVYSYEIGEVKPHPGAYRAAATALGLEPSECVMVDDRAVNVEGARAAGMAAVLFDGRDATARVDALL